ncbi:hypothetical protein [Spiroplasma endosymbiont of Virgichneumon dumeticola]|uniref:hypothetical protein n=1 Tax=Spiroplasma endosymbiont of Virgichneumon dumeticola TaxID=3139323 RepID=UPI0035C8ACDF
MKILNKFKKSKPEINSQQVNGSNNSDIKTKKFTLSALSWPKFKKDYKEFNIFLGKNLTLLLASIFKNLRTYIYVYVIPITLLLIIYTFQSFGGINKLLPPIVAGYLLIPGFGITILLNTLISEWKASIFLKRIHVIGTSKYQFILSIWIVGYLLGMSSIFLGSCLLLGIAPLINSTSNVFLETFSFFSYGSASEVFVSWFGFFIAASIITLSGIGIATLIAGAFKSLSLCQSLTILIICGCIMLSDLFLSPTITSKSSFVVYISYLIPQKYGAWTVFYSSAAGNINYFIDNPTSKLATISFANIYGPLFGGITYCIGLYVASLFTFNWNNRG